MKPGDYEQDSRISKSGKQISMKIVTAKSGHKYEIGPKMGKGGVAKVFKARRLTDGKEFAFKEYVPSPELIKTHRNIKKNIQRLMAKPILGEDNKPLKSFIGPLDIIELNASRSFGYIMDVVDTSSYVTLKKLFHRSTYPNAKILCKICKNIADFFRRVHSSGWCYKDINEDNIYINHKNGDFFIIDCDNISVPKTKTILGTAGYMAPEVYVNNTPNMRTDQFSMAVYFYRLLVGGYPMEGKRTEAYLKKTNQSIQEAGSKIYGSDALFTFDPKDNSNTIRGLVDDRGSEKYALQTKLWDNLPKEVKQCFYKTFSDGLKEDKSTLRTTDLQWITVFSELEQSGLVKCKCGEYNFGSSKLGKQCWACDANLPVLKSRTQSKPVVSKPVIRKPIGKELNEVVFKVLRDIEPRSLLVTAQRKASIPGNEIHRVLDASPIMRIEYSPKRNLLSAVNLTSRDWNISINGTKSICNPGKRVILQTGCVITVLHRKLQLRVVEVK